MPKTPNFWIFILSPGTSSRGATWDLEWRRQGPRVAAAGTSSGGAKGPRLAAPKGPRLTAPPRYYNCNTVVAPRVEVPWRGESRSLGTK